MYFGSTVFRAIRYWSRHRVVGAAVCVMLSVSMAVSVSLFAVLDGVWLRAVPYGHANALVSLARVNPASGRAIATARDYLTWNGLGDIFEHVGAFSQESVYVARSGEAERITGIAASPSLFAALDESAAEGRLFDDTETDVALLTSRGARGRFAGTRLGGTLIVNGRATTIVGMLPDRFSEMLDGELVLPLPARPSGTLKLIGRLRSGISPAAAEAAMDASSTSAGATGGRALSQWSSRVRPVRSLFVGEHVGLTLWLLFAIVILLQLVSVTNAAILMTLTTEGERRDVAIQLMLGARLREVLRETTVRGMLLAGVAAAAALLLVAWTESSLVSIIPRSVPRLPHIGVNSGAVVFSALSGCVVAFAIAYGPALVVSRTSPLEALRGRSRRASPILARAFVAAAAGLACVILIAAVSFAQSLRQLTAQPIGFDPRGIVAFGVDAPNAKPFDWQRHESVRRAVLAELEHATEVTAFAAGDMPPFSGMGAAYSFRTLDGVDGPAAETDAMIEHRRVTPGYFAILNIPVLAGRDFTERDQPGTPPVAIVTELAARRYWPGTSPIGKRVLLTSGEEPATVVGIVGDVRQVGFDREPVPMIYRPWLQEPRSGLILLVEPSGSVGAFLEAMGREQRPLARAASIGRIRRLENDLDRSVLHERFRTQLLLAFALLATVICAAGVIAVTAAAVVRNRRDLAIKLSLGAHVGHLIASLSVHACVLPVVIGIATATLLTLVGWPLASGVLPPGMYLGFSTVAIACALTLLASVLSSGLTSGIMVRHTPLELLRLE